MHFMPEKMIGSSLSRHGHRQASVDPAYHERDSTATCQYLKAPGGRWLHGSQLRRVSRIEAALKVAQVRAEAVHNASASGTVQRTVAKTATVAIVQTFKTHQPEQASILTSVCVDRELMASDGECIQPVTRLDRCLWAFYRWNLGPFRIEHKSPLRKIAGVQCHSLL
jgi:hypothetical protein